MNSLLDLDHLEITNELTGRVIAARKGYAQIATKNSPWVVATVGGTPAIIDGGMPIYGWFGLHTKTPVRGAHVMLLGKHIGTVTDAGPRTCIAECGKFSAHIGATPVDLFFLFHASGKTVTIATSRKRGELDLREGEEASVNLS